MRLKRTAVCLRRSVGVSSGLGTMLTFCLASRHICSCRHHHSCMCASAGTCIALCDGSRLDRSLQVLYGIVVQHFSKCAAEQPAPMAKLDVLMAQLLAMTPEVPIYAATAARARLSRALAALHSALQRLNEHDASACETTPGSLSGNMLLHGVCLCVCSS